ncbi:ATPase family AAA domain-containing protein 3A homolog [Nilaparvata lugens]|uniref:ATPase family AAA domain-containing protein 3A homolog n=1 Tax=Nilaparvata lugens TaxID=108931 RepID=UPI00193D0A40|nr:ATPase family AAA domain-containing protein 3A homolog [Nilaparvata lugens]
MSWIFGYGKKDPQLLDPSQEMPPGTGKTEGGGLQISESDMKKMEAYRFDSAALERAAQAARELEKSKHAKEALELSKMQEVTKQQELMVNMKAYEAEIERGKVQQKQVDAEERRKTLQEETRQHQARAQYQDQLSRKRYEDQLLQQQKINDENLRRQEESVAKQEAMRKATVEHEMQLRAILEMKKIQAEMEAKAKADRENRDINLEQIRLKAVENRATILESIKWVLIYYSKYFWGCF